METEEYKLYLYRLKDGKYVLVIKKNVLNFFKI